MGKLIALRSLANGRIVCAEAGGDQPLIANRDGVGPWETFELIELGDVSNGPPVPNTQSPEPKVPNNQLINSSIRKIQITDDPALVNRTYSYWSNAWVGSDGVVLVFAPTSNGPVLFEVRDASVRRIGPIPGYGGTGEGMYFTLDGSLIVLDGPRMRRLRPYTGSSEVLFDISAAYPGCRLFQAHSSEDGQVHSATVERIVSDGPYQRIGTCVFRNNRLGFWPSDGRLDESQIDASGNFLLIKEGDDNAIVTLATGETRTIRDAEGALGHSDMGQGFAVGEANLPEPGRCIWLSLSTLQRRDLFQTWAMGSISLRGYTCLHTDAKELALLDIGTGQRTPILQHGVEIPANATPEERYNLTVRGSLSPCGKVATYIGNGAMYLVTMP